MNDPQQLRRVFEEIRKALDVHSREELAEILALVFKEYVVDSTQPLASGAQVLDARSDLEGLGFAELIVWLQTHLDVPELALFEVSGAEVSVRAEGRSLRLRTQAQPTAPAPAAVAANTPPLAARASTSLPAQTSPTNPPPASGPPASPPPSAAQPGTGTVAPDKDEPSTAETGTRFSLLEVD
jgi:hypothetical protein